MREAFEELGDPYSLEVLRDGESAIGHFDSYQTPEDGVPSLVILDLHVPKFKAPAILKALRSNPHLANVNVAVLTTLASPRERADVLDLGVNLYRTKPSSWDDALSLARELMDLCKKPPAVASRP